MVPPYKPMCIYCYTVTGSFFEHRSDSRKMKTMARATTMMIGGSCPTFYDCGYRYHVDPLSESVRFSARSCCTVRRSISLWMVVSVNHLLSDSGPMRRSTICNLLSGGEIQHVAIKKLFAQAGRLINL